MNLKVRFFVNSIRFIAMAGTLNCGSNDLSLQIGIPAKIFYMILSGVFFLL